MELRDKNGLTEAEFLAQYDSSMYKKPSVTADVALIARDGAETKILTIRRGGHPYLGKWALPGGFAEEGESVEETAARELMEETGIEGIRGELFGVFSKPGRDPRGWVVTCAFRAVVDFALVRPSAGDDAADARWFTVTSRSPLAFTDGRLCLSAADLAFDHEEIITRALGGV